MAAFAWPFFRLVDTQSPLWIHVAVAVGLVIHAAMYAPHGVLFAELFGRGFVTRGPRSGISCLPAGRRPGPADCLRAAEVERQRSRGRLPLCRRNVRDYVGLGLPGRGDTRQGDGIGGVRPDRSESVGTGGRGSCRAAYAGARFSSISGSAGASPSQSHKPP